MPPACSGSSQPCWACAGFRSCPQGGSGWWQLGTKLRAVSGHRAVEAPHLPGPLRPGASLSLSHGRTGQHGCWQALMRTGSDTTEIMDLPSRASSSGLFWQSLVCTKSSRSRRHHTARTRQSCPARGPDPALEVAAASPGRAARAPSPPLHGTATEMGMN